MQTFSDRWMRPLGVASPPPRGKFGVVNHKTISLRERKALFSLVEGAIQVNGLTWSKTYHTHHRILRG